ncbi:hypothetical protein B0O99DRAFT_680692 [Bisporella sp. PMI_857]|nr:hypothetical protein B0O99DRAFT_680692 [Bisporella sp. PMI_857]
MEDFRDSSCPICMEYFTTRVTVKPCRHEFDFHCIKEWSRGRYHNDRNVPCPLCLGSIASIGDIPILEINHGPIYDGFNRDENQALTGLDSLHEQTRRQYIQNEQQVEQLRGEQQIISEILRTGLQRMTILLDRHSRDVTDRLERVIVAIRRLEFLNESSSDRQGRAELAIDRIMDIVEELLEGRPGQPQHQEQERESREANSVVQQDLQATVPGPGQRYSAWETRFAQGPVVGVRRQAQQYLERARRQLEERIGQRVVNSESLEQDRRLEERDQMQYNDGRFELGSLPVEREYNLPG